MLIPTPPRILVARDPVGFRESIDGLAIVSKLDLQEEPLDGTLYMLTSLRQGPKMLV